MVTTILHILGLCSHPIHVPPYRYEPGFKAAVFVVIALSFIPAYAVFGQASVPAFTWLWCTVFLAAMMTHFRSNLRVLAWVLLAYGSTAVVSGEYCRGGAWLLLGLYFVIFIITNLVRGLVGTNWVLVWEHLDRLSSQGSGVILAPFGCCYRWLCSRLSDRKDETLPFTVCGSTDYGSSRATGVEIVIQV